MKIFRIIPIIVLAAAFLAACAGPVPTAPAAPIPGVGGVDLAKAFSDFKAYYNAEYQIQKAVNEKARIYQQGRSNYDLTISDMIANNAICYKDVKTTQVAIQQATYGTAASNQPLDKGTLINALVANASDKATSECAQNNQKISDYVVSGRQAVLDAYNNMYDAAMEFIKSLNQDLEIKFMNDLLQTYGDPTLVEQKLKDAGLPGFTDIVWFPTEDLWFDMPNNRTICTYYQSGAFENDLLASVKTKFFKHEDSLMRLYEAQWIPNAVGGTCRLYRQAALVQITMPILSASTQNVINTGTDTGAIPTPQP